MHGIVHRLPAKLLSDERCDRYQAHLAHFGVNLWSLQRWLGHTSIEMTLRYVRYAERYCRPISPEILSAGEGHANPDERAGHARRALAGAHRSWHRCGTRRTGTKKARQSGPLTVAGAGFEPATFGL